MEDHQRPNRRVVFTTLVRIVQWILGIKDPLNTIPVYCSVICFVINIVLFFITLGYELDGESDIVCYSQGSGFKTRVEDDNVINICRTHYRVRSAGGDLNSYSPVLSFMKERIIVVSFLNLIPIVLKLFLEHKPIKAFLQDPGKTDEEIQKNTKKYWNNYAGSHGGLLRTRFIIAIVCIMVPITQMYIMDLATNGKFFRIPTFYPFTRQENTFTDLVRDSTSNQNTRESNKNELGNMLPVTALCSITPNMALSILNTENYGCRYPHNQSYEAILYVQFVIYGINTFISVFCVLYYTLALLLCQGHARVPLSPYYQNSTKQILKTYSEDELWVLGHLKTVAGHDTLVTCFDQMLELLEENSPQEEELQAIVPV
ncbi:hypothetical protein OTU49_011433 [Cherax quadricarinatus]|uniref:Uncharacterized protein n=1 Tax=Cherax quadricarinatus TaxID=27406 RepID=A0AAW0W577_CHEQU